MAYSAKVCGAPPGAPRLPGAFPFAPEATPKGRGEVHFRYEGSEAQAALE